MSENEYQEKRLVLMKELKAINKQMKELRQKSVSNCGVDPKWFAQEMQGCLNKKESINTMLRMGRLL